MDAHLKLHIISYIKDQVKKMAEEYASRQPSHFKCIWIPNTDYLVKVLPCGENILISPIDENIINSIYDILYKEEYTYHNQREAIQFIFLYYEQNYIEWKDWYCGFNSDRSKYSVISKPLGDYDDPNSWADYLNQEYKKSTTKYIYF